MTCWTNAYHLHVTHVELIDDPILSLLQLRGHHDGKRCVGEDRWEPKMWGKQNLNAIESGALQLSKNMHMHTWWVSWPMPQMTHIVWKLLNEKIKEKNGLRVLNHINHPHAKDIRWVWNPIGVPYHLIWPSFYTLESWWKWILRPRALPQQSRCYNEGDDQYLLHSSKHLRFLGCFIWQPRSGLFYALEWPVSNQWKPTIGIGKVMPMSRMTGFRKVMRMALPHDPCIYTHLQRE